MSDGDKIFYNSWCEAVNQQHQCPEPQWIECGYHKLKTWGRHKGLTSHPQLYQLFRLTLSCTDNTKHNEHLMNIKRFVDDNILSPKTTKYIEDQLLHIDQWAYIHRLNVGPTTNNVVESVNSDLKRNLINLELSIYYFLLNMLYFKIIISKPTMF